MTCPYCGKEIPDEHIYCDFCGKEFQIVPDFDYEVEEKISKSMEEIKEQVGQDTSIIGKIPVEEDIEEEYFLEEDPNLIVSVVKHFKGKKMAKIIAASVGGLLLILLVSQVCHFIRVNSYDYLYQKSLQCIEKGNYGEATEYLEKLMEKNSHNSEVKMLLANCYMKSDNTEAAILMLREVIAEDQTNIEAYSKIVSIYENNKEYDEINDLLAGCKEESVLQYFQSYIALEPVFSAESGTYSEAIVLSLSANADGTIYYTMDGSIPDENSTVYTAPIVLEETKEYTICAVFVNHYGVSSDIVANTYILDLTVPEAPKVSLESGTYSVPQMIEVEVPAGHTAYYTIDGDVPDETSTPYTTPLLLQLGTHKYQFVTYSNAVGTSKSDDHAETGAGVAGEITVCHYTLAMNTLFSGEKALDYSKQFLVNYGFIKDVEGHVADKTGHNEYSINTAFIYNETPYFLVVEKYVDTLGTAVSTGNLYAFDANDTRFYRAFELPEGGYRVEPILDY